MTGWLGFIKTLLGAAGVFCAMVVAFTAVMNPFGNLPLHLAGPHIIMDSNQRAQFPAIVRSLSFDSIVIGTSTSALLDPAILESHFGGRFANLAMNDGRAWEQVQLIQLYLDEVGPPRNLIIGLDVVWCDQDAVKNRISKGRFPHWLYDKNPVNDWLHLINAQTVEIAFRQLGYRLGWSGTAKARNGFKIFTPPEDRYDAARASGNIWRFRNRNNPPQSPPFKSDTAALAALEFPALKWLERLLQQLSESSRVALVFMPVHIAAQPVPSSRNEAVERACKARVAALARRYKAFAIDFRIASPITTADDNYWDRLHYRVPIGRRIVEGMNTAMQGAKRSASGDWRLLQAP